VHRIGEIGTTRRRFEPAEDFDFDAYIGSSFGVIAEPATRVRIRFERRWASYVEERTWHPTQTLTPGPRGSVELTMEAGGTAELRQWVLSFGSGAEVLEPEALRAEVVAELEAACTRYRTKDEALKRRSRRAPASPSSRRSQAH